MLHVLRQSDRYEPVGLITMFNAETDRVAMHGVRRELLQAQSVSLNLPLVEVDLPPMPPNSVYEAGFADAVREFASWGVRHVAFGDLFLEDIRSYRISLCERLGIEPLFPIWTEQGATKRVAEEILAAGFRGVVCCVDTRHLPAEFLGREYDAAFLAELPPGVDWCGENGEFHTQVLAGPGLRDRWPCNWGKSPRKIPFVVRFATTRGLIAGF
jgi:diphthamide synthase (EF-2-diphthine--ammonia ligase)